MSVAPDTTITSEQTVDDLQRIEPLLARESLMRAVGVEADLHTAKSQRLLVRAGHVRVEGWSGDRSEGLTGELRYSITRPAASFTFDARRSPSAVTGAFLAGDAVTLNASARVVGDLRLIARAHSGSSSLVGATRRVVNKGAATGLQFSRKQTRVTLQAKYAELHASSLHRITRTASLNVAIPFRMTRFNADLEAGTADHNGVARPYRAFRGRVGFFEEKDVNFGVSASYNEYGVGPTRLRLDADAAVAFGNFLIEGGGGYGRGQVLGTDVHSWVSIEAPQTRSTTLLATIDHTRWEFKSSPYIIFADDFDLGSPWRFTVGIRQPLSVVVPFLRKSH